MSHTQIYIGIKELCSELKQLATELPEHRKPYYSKIISLLDMFTGNISGEFITRAIPFASWIGNRIGVDKIVNFFLKHTKSDISEHLIEIMQAHRNLTAHPSETKIANCVLDFLQQVACENVLPEVLDETKQHWVNIEVMVEKILMPVLIPTLLAKVDDTIKAAKISQDKSTNSDDRVIDVIKDGFNIAIALCETTDNERLKDGLNGLNKRIIQRLLNGNIKDQRSLDVVKSLLNNVINKVILSPKTSANEKKQILVSFEDFIKFIKETAENDSQSINKYKFKNLVFDVDNKPKKEIILAIQSGLLAGIPVLREFINYSPVTAITSAYKKLETEQDSFLSIDLSALKTMPGIKDEHNQAINILLELQQALSVDKNMKTSNDETFIRQQAEYSKNISTAMDNLNLDNIIFIVDKRLITTNNTENPTANYFKKEYGDLLHLLIKVKTQHSHKPPQEILPLLIDAHGKISSLKEYIATNGLDERKRLFFERYLKIDGRVDDFGTKSKGGARIQSLDNQFHLTDDLNKLSIQIDAAKVSLETPAPKKQAPNLKVTPAYMLTKKQEILGVLPSVTKKSSSKQGAPAYPTTPTAPFKNYFKAATESTTQKSLLNKIVAVLLWPFKIIGIILNSLLGSIVNVFTNKNHRVKTQPKSFEASAPSSVNSGLYEFPAFSEVTDASNLDHHLPQQGSEQLFTHSYKPASSKSQDKPESPESDSAAFKANVR